jgi:hypothetical protein
MRKISLFVVRKTVFGVRCYSIAQTMFQPAFSDHCPTHPEWTQRCALNEAAGQMGPDNTGRVYHIKRAVEAINIAVPNLTSLCPILHRCAQSYYKTTVSFYFFFFYYCT